MSESRRFSRASSPALIVAVIALVIALGGVATGAMLASDGSISACQDTRNGSLRVVDSGQQCRPNETPLTIASMADGKVANSDQLDGRDSTAYHRGAFGLIAANGSLVSGRGIEVTHLETNASGGPVYSIGFADDVTGCSIQLTVVSTAKSLLYSSIPDGSAAATFIADHGYPVYQSNVDSGIMVRTRDAAGAVVTRPFQVAAIC